MGEVEAGEDDDGSGRVTLTPFGRWTHDMEQGKSTLGWCLGVVGPGRKTPPPGVPGSCKIDDVAKGYADDAIIVLQEGRNSPENTPLGAFQGIACPFKVQMLKGCLNFNK
ncbi:hypothetical protein PCH_Pc13g09670 [Penicillium rubens Wisconsin 54-1255]|uniref:Uncharacterized protein n=1 Tax=Penicillium rubens (strain ATCC 28089 / DSM 1075 / NRRL 1951 / Wisconsin 54-1255) TaxID=500485 RepID=B6H444_PENRW|nr:hypothetical protein PCH_Pc13g09670 [Penicillium rubens Wisconsin 54-1255]